MSLYDIVRDRYNYDEKTSWLTWKNSKRKKWNGKRAGCLRKDGYRIIRIDRENYLEHRIIWLWCKGFDTENEIDHINRKRDDNRISNLREATPSCNQKNKGISCNNKTGVNGVSRLKNGKFRVYIYDNKGEQIPLGNFNTLLDGSKARYLGEVEYNYENCNSTSTALKYIKDNEPEWLNGNMQVEKNGNKTSNVKGVSFNKVSNKWKSYIWIDKKTIYLGSFIDLDDAVMTRYEAEVKYNKTKDSQAYGYLIERNLL